MKTIIILLSVICLSACSLTSHIQEDKLFITRRYVGSFVSYDELDKNGLMIKTTKVDDYGFIFVYGRKCHFQTGERLYIRRSKVDYPIQNQYWAYFVETDNNKKYILKNSKYGYKVLNRYDQRN